MKKLFSIFMAAMLFAGFAAVAAPAEDFEPLEIEAEIVAPEIEEEAAGFADILAQFEDGALGAQEAFAAFVAGIEAQERTEEQQNAFAQAHEKVDAALAKLSDYKRERLMLKFLYLNARTLYELCDRSDEFYLTYFNFWSYELAIFFPLALWQGLVEDGFLAFVYAVWNFFKFVAGGTVRYVCFGWLWMGL